MARRRRSYGPRGTALGHNITHQIINALSKLHTRMQRCNLPPEITPYQFIDLVAPPQDRGLLKRIHEITDLDLYFHTSVVELALGDAVSVNFDVGSCIQKVCLPKNPQLQPDADPELITAIKTWAGRAAEIGWEFGRLERVVMYLDATCTSAAQMRYLWPSITALVRVAKLDDILPRFDGTPGTVPAIHTDARNALRAGAGTIAVACILEDEDAAAVNQRAERYVQMSPHYSRDARSEGFGSYNAK